MSSQEFVEWIAYHEMNPFGPERDDLRIGILASVIVNLVRGKKGKRAKPKDFMPDFRIRAKKSVEELASKIAQINAMFGGKDLRKGQPESPSINSDE